MQIYIWIFEVQNNALVSLVEILNSRHPWVSVFLKKLQKFPKIAEIY